MIEQTPEEIAQAMKEHPTEWAQVYIETRQVVFTVLKQLQHYKDLVHAHNLKIAELQSIQQHKH